MMLLGLVIHSAASYTKEPLGAAWPYKDPNTSAFLDVVIFFIHLFRMPVFFVAAGFFAALLMARDGAGGFLANRVKRVLLPLALFWPIVYTGVAAGFVYANGRAAGQVDMTRITSGAFLGTASLVHLWFLWDLMIFCLVAVALAPLATRVPWQWLARVDSAFGAIATTMSGALAMAAVSTLTLLPMELPGLDTSVALLPPLRVLVAYGVFFAFGWLLYRQRALLETFDRRWKGPMIVGAISSVAYLVLAVGKPIADPLVAHTVACAFAAASMWMLIYGVVGAFVALLGQSRPVVRYLSDASYWMYIVHLPFAIGIAGLLAPYQLPAPLKFAMTVAAITLITLGSYHYLVRSTAVGALLNGRRYPRALPKPQPAQHTVAV